MDNWLRDAIAIGGQATAEVVGYCFDVYRLKNSSATNFLSKENRIARIPISYRVSKNEDPPIETEKRLGIIWYLLQGSFRQFRLGDVFKLNDPNFCVGSARIKDTEEFVGFGLAQKEPRSYGGRLNTTVKIYRPKVKVKDGYWEPMGQGQADEVLLQNGKFVLDEQQGFACEIPCGLSAMRPYGDRAISDVPAMNRKALYGAYLPPLTGLSIQEGDRLVAADGARYVVMIPYFQGVPAVGYQLTLEREVSQAGKRD